MSKIEINKLTNANVYLDGVNLLGRAEEVQLPQIKHKMAEHKALGMVGSAEFFAGIDKMECKIKWNALYPAVLRTCSNPFTAAMIQVRASLETYNGTGKTFGYHHYQKFKDVAVLQKIFNHYSPQITMRYIGIDQDMIDDSYNNFIL